MKTPEEILKWWHNEPELKAEAIKEIQEYAREYAKACLAKAAERADAIIAENEFGEDMPFVCKSSINSEDNLI